MTSKDVVGSGAPLDVSALRVLVEVEAWVNEVFWLAKTVPGAPVGGVGFAGRDVVARLQFAYRVADDTGEWGFLSEAPGVLRRVRGVFDPARVIPLRGWACPVCATEVTPIQVEPGEFTESAALAVSFLVPDESSAGSRSGVRADCRECGASWVDDEIVDLAAVLGGDTRVAGLLASVSVSKRVS
ncbi:hypothetical protein [Auritidibacter ignavus]|uniref:hypothetical protein n=1 Tax=Auritidibacter ignavus TaxID=678932 RepID=UPI002FE685AB